MKTIKYSLQLLKDFHELVRQFKWFMTMNLLHADQGLHGECQKAVLGLIRHSLTSAEELDKLFVEPYFKNEEINKGKMIRNCNATITFFEKYLNDAGAILKSCKLEIYTGRYKEIYELYVVFVKKYLS